MASKVWKCDAAKEGRLKRSRQKKQEELDPKINVNTVRGRDLNPYEIISYKYIYQ